MAPDKIYWDAFLQARVVVHDPMVQGAEPGNIPVRLLDVPAITPLTEWGGISPPPGTLIWISWENLKPLAVH